MNSEQAKRFRPFVLLGAALVLWVLVPVGLKRAAEQPFREFQAPFWTSASYLNDLQSFWAIRTREDQDLIEAGRTLSRINAALQSVVLAENETLREYNQRLRDLLSLPTDPGFRPVVARVVRRDLSVFWQRVLIRKGRDAGILPGAGVIFHDGVVGRVREVYAYTSSVELVSRSTAVPGNHWPRRGVSRRNPDR